MLLTDFQSDVYYDIALQYDITDKTNIWTRVLDCSRSTIISFVIFQNRSGPIPVGVNFFNSLVHFTFQSNRC